MTRTFRLLPGETHFFHGRLDAPELHVTGTGRLAYLWIGGEGCVGTLAGTATLRALARAILQATRPRKPARAQPGRGK